jgi:uncharacterized membrane protein
MAGIGFELRKLLERDSLTGLAQAYAYAAVISSGPWVLSIIGILFVGFMSASAVTPAFWITQFQVSVTYLIAGSLILTGPVQLAFTRFVADRLFEKQKEAVLPNFNGMLLLVIAGAGVVALPAVLFLFPGESVAYRLLMLSGFVLLSGIWVATLLLSGLKQYKQIVGMYALGYGIVMVAATMLKTLGLEGLLFGFVLGHFVMFAGMVLLIARGFPSPRFIAYEFIERGRMFPALILGGLLYNLAIWADKLVFWFHPDTGQAVIGPLRASVIYDLPVFLAYLSIIPGMAVFLTRMETDFVEYYERFYTTVRDGGSLDELENLRDEMVLIIRQGLGEIVKIQAIAVLVLFVAGPALLRALDISELYLSLLQVQVISAGLQVVLLGILNVFFYLDKRVIVLALTLLLAGCNVLLSLATIRLGAPYYGYGFACALLVTVLAATWLLGRKLDSLEYETFMLQ